MICPNCQMRKRNACFATVVLLISCLRIWTWDLSDSIQKENKLWETRLDAHRLWKFIEAIYEEDSDDEERILIVLTYPPTHPTRSLLSIITHITRPEHPNSFTTLTSFPSHADFLSLLCWPALLGLHFSQQLAINQLYQSIKIGSRLPPLPFDLPFVNSGWRATCSHGSRRGTGWRRRQPQLWEDEKITLAVTACPRKRWMPR